MQLQMSTISNLNLESNTNNLTNNNSNIII